jgi:ACS family glucarate transporter-like MFS transporter
MSGYILQATGSYSGVLVFVAAHSLLAIVTYLFVVGELRRVVLKEPASAAENMNTV